MSQPTVDIAAPMISAIGQLLVGVAAIATLLITRRRTANQVTETPSQPCATSNLSAKERRHLKGEACAYGFVLIIWFWFLDYLIYEDDVVDRRFVVLAMLGLVGVVSCGVGIGRILEKLKKPNQHLSTGGPGKSAGGEGGSDR